MTTHKTGTREQWLKARLELLKAEKELTRRSDEIARKRQELPWVQAHICSSLRTEHQSWQAGTVPMARQRREKGRSNPCSTRRLVPLGRYRKHVSADVRLQKAKSV
jgi:uncharacterized protein DUF899